MSERITYKLIEVEGMEDDRLDKYVDDMSKKKEKITKDDVFTNTKVFPLVGGFPLPFTVLTDSYKVAHAFQYPHDVHGNGKVTKMIAYGEFRGPLKEKSSHEPRSNYNLNTDNRIVFYGMRYLLDTYLKKQWTEWDVEMSDRFFSTHNAFNTKYPFPKHLFLKFVRENDGYFPVKVESLPEGSVIYPHIPVYQISTHGEYSPLVTFLETIMTHIWYPCTVATLSRKCRAVVESYFEKTGIIESLGHMIDYKLQDFGFRGCTCLEQAIIGGTAHLLNFKGSDTMCASFYVQYVLNNGVPIAESIPATEHSVMLSFGKDKTKVDDVPKNELAAIENMINKFGKGVFACVMDTYDYHNTIFRLIPMIFDKIIEHGGPMVLRPDSGTPHEVVLDALIAIECAYEAKGMKIRTNEKDGVHYQHFDHFSVIQGDGVNLAEIDNILGYVTDHKNRLDRIEILHKGKFSFEGGEVIYDKGFLISEDVAKKLLAKKNHSYSPINCTFGMGGGLLQKVNRDSMKFATKLNYLEVDREGKKESRTVMKDPKTDPGKRSLPGELEVCSNDDGPTVYPKGAGGPDKLLRVVYNKSGMPGNVELVYDESFDVIRERVNREWKQFSPTRGDNKVKSKEISELQNKTSGHD